jgi:hypothetical protein
MFQPSNAASGSSSHTLVASLSPRRGRLVVARRFNGGKRKRKAFILAPQARAPDEPDLGSMGWRSARSAAKRIDSA